MICFEDFELDPGTAELRKAGAPVPIEPQVFDLIVYLVENAGRVVGHDDLIASVWQGRIVSDAAISSRISAARTALGDDGKTQRLIRTIPRRGFRFVGEVQGLARRDPEDDAPITGTGVRFVKSFDGVNLAYEVTGAGPPLVKAPNFLSHLEFERDGPVWQPTIREFSKTHSFVRLDQRGNGLSDREVETISFDAFVKDLKAVFDKLDIARAPLLGMSQGAAIAVEFAHRWPERVSGLILIGGYAAGWRVFGDPELEARRNAMVDLMRVGWGGQNPVFRQMYTNLFVPDGSDDLKGWFTDLQRVSSTPDTAARILDSFGNIDVRGHLPEIAAPTLVLHCRGDGVVPMAAGQDFAREIPDARFVTLDSANHIPLKGFDCWPVFIREVQDFLARLPS